MIVLDDQLGELVAPIRKWYWGRVALLQELREGRIADEEVPRLLMDLDAPVFITENHDDFWRRVDGHPAYTILCFPWPRERRGDIPPRLRRLLTFAGFLRRYGLYGTVVSVGAEKVRYYRRRSGPVLEIVWDP